MARLPWKLVDIETRQVFVCAGPPQCLLEDDEAVEAMKAGCPWCKVTTVHPDGAETVRQPGRA